MASDIRLNDNNTISVEGNLGFGTSAPVRPVHAENGELHSGGPGGGISFADRSKPGFVSGPTSGQRWVWYADAGQARLWSGGDALKIGRKGGNGTTFQAELVGDLKISRQAGTGAPARPLHVDSGEIHSGGTHGGLSFANRSTADFVENPDDGQRWLWYSVNGHARLWSGTDALEVLRGANNTFNLGLKGDILGGGLDGTTAKLVKGANHFGTSTVRTIAEAISLDHPSAPTHVAGPITQLTPGASARSVIDPEPTPPIPEQTSPLPPRLALAHDYVEGQRDSLVLNHTRKYGDGVVVDGNLKVTGVFSQASSAALKDEVAELSGAAAMATLRDLNPVTYRYKADATQEQHVGFIAEDVPDLVASAGRDRLAPMDIVAVLTRAVQEQQKTISALVAEVDALRS